MIFININIFSSYFFVFFFFLSSILFDIHLNSLGRLPFSDLTLLTHTYTHTNGTQISIAQKITKSFLMVRLYSRQTNRTEVNFEVRTATHIV